MIGGRWPYLRLVQIEQLVIFTGSINLLLKDIKHVVDNGTIRFQKKHVLEKGVEMLLLKLQHGNIFIQYYYINVTLWTITNNL